MGMVFKKVYRFFFKKVFSILHFFVRYVFFIYSFFVFQKLSKKNNTTLPVFKEQYPCLTDDTGNSEFEPHYTYHPAWAARVLARQAPKKHIDISSQLSFSLLVSAFIPVEFYDYRPADIKLDNFFTGKADLTHLPFSESSIESLSCMHVIEHVGLGRYGDPLDPKGDQKAANELKRVLAPGGKFLFVVPVGKSTVRFNAHRVYSYEQILDLFSGLKLEQFDLLPDKYDQGIIYNADPALVKNQKFGCGLFIFTK